MCAWEDQTEITKYLLVAQRYLIWHSKGNIISIKVLFINNGQSSSFYLLCTLKKFLLLNISWAKGHLLWLLNYTIQKLLGKKSSMLQCNNGEFWESGETWATLNTYFETYHVQTNGDIFALNYNYWFLRCPILFSNTVFNLKRSINLTVHSSEMSALVCISYQNILLITGHLRRASVTAISKKSIFCTLF